MKHAKICTFQMLLKGLKDLHVCWDLVKLIDWKHRCWESLLKIST